MLISQRQRQRPQWLGLVHGIAGGYGYVLLVAMAEEPAPTSTVGMTRPVESGVGKVPADSQFGNRPRPSLARP